MSYHQGEQPAEEIAQALKTQSPDWEFLRGFYQDLHAHPELSGFEKRTASKIQEALAPLNCEVIKDVGGYGVLGVFRNGEGPTVLMRADFDALPVKETSGLSYASTKEMVDHRGVNCPVMHACGHDMHTTGLIGAAQILDGMRDYWSGTFIALFQPAEELGNGAEAMVADGLKELIARPDVCLAQHIVPGRAGQIMSTPGPVFAACDSIRITITGRSAHGSMPQASIDPTIIAAMIVLRLQAIVAREIGTSAPAVISVGTLKAGDTHNTIPGSAELVLNTRCFSEEIRNRLNKAIQRVVRAECEASGCQVDPTFDYFGSAAAVVNDPEVQGQIRPVFDAVFAADSIDAQPSYASEDFSEIPKAWGVPYSYWTVGCTERELWDQAQAEGRVDALVPTNHSGDFVPEYEPTISALCHAAAAGALAYLWE